MDEDEIRAVVQATLREMTPEPAPEPEPPELHPHRVKHKGKAIETAAETRVTFDQSRAPKGTSGDPKSGWTYRESVDRYVGVLECPDCGSGLRSGSGSADEMVCMRIPVGEKLPAGDGGIVACGLKE